MKNPLFIVGAQRSGTTLLRLILNSHSTIAIPEEARFLTPVLKRSVASQPISGAKLEKLRAYLLENQQFKNWNYDRTDFFNYLSSVQQITLSELIDAMYSSFAASENKARWADKSLFFDSVELLSDIFPESKFIHIVRDGRDVFSSWRTMDPSKNFPAAVALDWTYKLRKIENALATLPPTRALVVRYEDLIGDPEQSITTICNFCEIDFEPAMMNFHETSSRYIGEHHSKLIFKPIDKSNKAKWKTRLTQNEADAFSLCSAPFLKKYGYEASAPKISLSLLSYIATDLIVGIPQRALQVFSARSNYRRSLKRGEATNVEVGEAPKNSGME